MEQEKKLDNLMEKLDKMAIEKMEYEIKNLEEMINNKEKNKIWKIIENNNVWGSYSLTCQKGNWGQETIDHNKEELKERKKQSEKNLKLYREKMSEEDWAKRF